MSMIRRPIAAAFAAVCVVVSAAGAAVAAPPSWTSPGLAPLDRVPAVDFPPVDHRALAAEDEANIGKDVPFRVAVPLETDVRPGALGLFEMLPDGDRLWRVRLRSTGALWTVVGFESWRLQPGASLWVYDPAGRKVRGPFTSADRREHGELWIPGVEGDTAVVELRWPASWDATLPDVRVGRVLHGYKRFGDLGAGGDPPPADPNAGACEIDINCPLGANWQDEKRGVVNLLTTSGGLCTGSLIRNTDNDCKNYVLTAAHCLSSQSSASGLIFQFNFERPQCGSGVAPTDMQLSGSFLRATYASSDVTLVEMDDPIPDAWEPYYNGWSRSTTPATESWCIHHPNNDEKKISYNDDPLTNGVNWGSTHWRVENWEQAATEPGSSGSPMFDQNSRIVGQLHGGTSSCTSLTYDEYGKIDVSWNGGGTAASRLKDWLDPSNSGVTTLDGVSYTVCRVPQPRLVYAAHVVDDAPGNGDGVADPGESFVLQVDVENRGTLGATGVSGTASTAKPLVAITDPSSAWPDIAQGATQRSAPPSFTVQLDPAFVCGDSIPIHLDLVAAESPGAWAADFVVPTGTAQVATVYQDAMEAGINGWTPQTLLGTVAWTQSTADTNPAHSPTHAWFANDPATRGDAVLVMPAVGALPANARLEFKHRFNTESTWDGGVLEYSTNGGGTWNDAGAMFLLNGYNSTIKSTAASNLAGRAAWSGDSGAWLTVRVDLGALAGQSVGFRWRMATDTSVSDEGWFVDDVKVESTSYTCNPPITVPGEASDPSGAGAPFRITKDPGGYLLSWSVPPSGGSPAGYRLYRSVLGGPFAPQCEANLGSGTSTVLPSLPDDRAFVVVAKNGSGEGSYGSDSTGAERSAASGGDLCP